MKGAVAPWKDLPAEILGLVLLRLPSLADRIHVRAVCRPWRVAGGAQRHLLPPPLPWFAFRDGGLLDLDDAPVRCAHILRDGVLGYLAVDNLALLVHDDGACSLLNPLTGLTIPLPKWPPAVRKVIEDMYGGFDQTSTRYVLVKAVLSSPLGSTPDAIVAILILEGFSVAIFASGQQDSVSIRMSPDLESIWFRPKIADIAFLHGKLYALTEQEGLHVAEVDAGRLSDLKSSLSFRQCIADDPKHQQMYDYDNENDDPVYLVLRYLVESNGKLLLVRHWTGYPQTAMLGDHAKTCRFEIFEADLATGPGQWTKVDSLGGRALFLMSSECSKSVLASQCPGGIQEDCVYFMHNFFDHPSAMYMGTSADPLADSGVYNMRDGKITPFLPEDIMERMQSKQQFLTWFFPVDA